MYSLDYTQFTGKHLGLNGQRFLDGTKGVKWLQEIASCTKGRMLQVIIGLYKG